jgi:large-conductance mechanosensitive channel
MSFNYKEFLFDNGIVGTTIGTLLGFATKKVFDVFRETALKPLLEILF